MRMLSAWSEREGFGALTRTVVISVNGEVETALVLLMDKTTGQLSSPGMAVCEGRLTHGARSSGELKEVRDARDAAKREAKESAKEAKEARLHAKEDVPTAPGGKEGDVDCKSQ